jgi:hypothetical protein
MRSYTSTATKLSRDLLAYDWKPPGSPAFYIPSEREDASQKADLKACVDKLNADLAADRVTLTRETRAIQLAYCMEEKGWRLLPVEIVVTS